MAALDRETTAYAGSAERTPRAAMGLLLLMLAPALILECWHAPFCRYDDAMIIHNPHLQPNAEWWSAWSIDAREHFYYPLTLWSWRFDREVFAPLLEPWVGEQAWVAAIRVSNLLLHAAGAVCVWLAIRALGGGAVLAAFVAAAAALHPTACESVCWAIERKNVLAGALGFAALWRYFAAASWRGHLLAAALFIAALLAKASVLGLFAVVLAWECLGRPRLGDLPSGGTTFKHWHAAVRLLPWVFGAYVLGRLNYTLQDGVGAVLPPLGGSLWSAFLTDHLIVWRYTENFLWPARLSAFYGIDPIRSLADVRFWAYAAAGYGLIAGSWAVCAPSKRRVLIFAWVWAIVALGPTLNFVGLTFAMQDRYAYLSAPGFWLAIGLTCAGLAARLPSLTARLPKWTAGAGVVGCALAWSWVSYAQGSLYADSRALFEQAAAREPRSSYAHLFLVGDLRAAAEAAYRSGDRDAATVLLDRAMVHAKRGIAAPDFERYLFQPAARLDLAQMYLDRGRIEDAAVQARKALDPSMGLPVSEAERLRALTLEGRAFLRAGKPDLALERFNGALALAPEDAELHLQSARALLSLRDYFVAAREDAKARALEAQARQALARVPESSPYRSEALRLLELLTEPRP